MNDISQYPYPIPEAANDSLLMHHVHTMAGLIAAPSDIPYNLAQSGFPVFNKILPFSNLTKLDALDIQDDIELCRLQKYSQARRYELANNDREQILRQDAYLTCAISQGMNGYMVKQLTTLSKRNTVSMEETKQPGFIGRILNRGKKE